MTITTFEEAQDLLAAKLPGYARRPHQMALAEKVELAIAENMGALLEAGCGTGKSLAALIPAILSGQRTIVATATKLLQNQYIHDLEFLQANLVDFTWAVLKGRSNYPCLAKIKDPGLTPTMAQARILTALSAPEIVSGEVIPDRETLPAASETEWQGLAMSAAECPGARNCPFSEKCYAERAKAKAASSKIVVTNLAYLMLDLLLRQRSGGNVAMLGDYEKLIVDEAHELGDKATDALSDSFGVGTFVKLSHDAAGFLQSQRRSMDAAEDIEHAARRLWLTIDQLFAERNQGNKESVPVRLSAADVIGLGAGLVDLVEALNTCRRQITEIKGIERGDRDFIARQRLMNRLADRAGSLSEILTAEGLVHWLEEVVNTRRGVTEKRVMLRTAPLSPASWLRSVIWERVPALMMSATLSTGRDFHGQADFSFLRRFVGLHEHEAIEFDAGSPFDFSKQALLYVPPKGIPEPKGATMSAWRTYAQSVTRRLVLAARGNALLLFTSRSAMDESYRVLADDFRGAGLTVLKQDDAPTPELVASLKKGGAVLFGLKSFFAGVDVQGQALSLVVLDKLPFAVPTDILFAARGEAIVALRGPWADFRELAIPTMTLPLIQGVGRLVRTVEDKGVMAILDPRLSTKGYGKTIQNSLPPARRTTEISEAVAFLETIAG